MDNVFIYDGEVYPSCNNVSLYVKSLKNALGILHAAMSVQGYPVISVAEAFDFISDNQGTGMFYILVGDSFISMVTEQEEWHSPGKVLCEEFFGPRHNEPVDLDEYMDAMKALAEYLGCTEFLLGTLANPRKDAMCRALKARGMEVKTITLRYKV